ncbi:uncharacterized protein LOC126668274 [Mercurialis annua]|uniref:uncharacterized protein LOC126668274 n=1 Tax=Mercurialis annua TaxID=3986 RepID=UPI0024AE22A3|nr:uncharacterized protein LOC126668274 [Mercurialis annua]
MATENFTHTLRLFFDGTDYPNWKFRMENYLDMDGVNLWHMVLDGYVAPTQEFNGGIISWPRKEWTKDHVLANALNRKAICVIISSLFKNKKVELLIGEYEGFKNKSNETVTETTNRLFGITTNLKKLGKHYTLGEINGKILRSLPLLDWQPKITAIEESHDIRNLRTDELIGNLLLHEMTYMNKIQELKKSQEEKTKGIALKAKSIESKVEEELNASDDEEMVLLSKKVREWRTRKKSQVQKYEQKDRNVNKAKEILSNGKKGFITTCDDESDYQSDEDCQEEARANLCFMALVDESPLEVSTLPFMSWDGVGIEPHGSSRDIVVVKNTPSASCVVNVENVLVDDSLVYEIDDECHDMINELTSKCSDYHAKIKFFKKEASMAKIEMLNLKKQIQDFKSSLESIPKQDVNILLKENETLKSEILSRNSSISRFHKGKESLDNLLDSQRNPTIKFGLGYSHNPSSSCVTTFVKASSPQTSSIEVPPSLVKPKQVKKRYAQAPKAKPFVAPKPKSKVGTRPPRHTHASQYSHKWEKRSMKKNHVHSYPYAHSHNNAHAYTYDHSCVHCYAHTCEAPRAKTYPSYAHMSPRRQCVYCMRYGHKNVPKKTVLGNVTFGYDAKGQVVGIGKIGNSSSPSIENVWLVNGLKHNLLSVSQLCDKGYNVNFDSKACYVIQPMDNTVIFKGNRRQNTYIIDLDTLENRDGKCLLSLSDESWLWHRRLGHASLDLLNEVSKDELVKGLPKLNFSKDKNEAFNGFKSFAKRVQKEKDSFISSIRSDHGTEFQNESFKTFCEENGISHNFSSPRTPQQNGVVERKNRTLVKMARSMLNEYDLPHYLWAEAMNTACYVSNRIFKRPILNKTSYELWIGRKPKISYFRVFGCKCFILNTKDDLGNFDSKTDEGVFLGYAYNSKSFRVFNKRTLVVEESMHVVFDESSKEFPEKDSFVHDFIGAFEDLTIVENQENPTTNVETPQQTQGVDKVETASPPPIQSHGNTYDLPKDWAFKKSHPQELIIGDASRGVSTRSHFRTLGNLAFLSQFEPTKVSEALVDENWVISMQDELNEFKSNKVWELVPPPNGQTIIGTKWARLVAQGYNEEEGIDYEETFAPGARLEAIRMLLEYASCMNFKLFQMDVKSAFLNGFIEEEVYVKQPPSFEDFKHPNYVYKLHKALYGLKQAPGAWYERLSGFFA